MKRIFLIFTLVFVLIGSGGVWANTFSFLDAAKYGDEFVEATQTAVKGVKIASRFPTYYSEVAESLSNLKWNNTNLLAQHYKDHGGSVGAQSAIDYIYRSKQFINRAIEQKLPTKFDVNDVTFRVWDPATGEFASFYRDGGIRTYFNKFDSNQWIKQNGYIIK